MWQVPHLDWQIRSIRKQADQPVSSFPLQPLFQFCLQVPALTFSDRQGCGSRSQVTLFLPDLLLVMVFHHSNRNPKKSIISLP